MKKYIVTSIASFLGIVVLIISFMNNSFDVVKNAASNSFNDLLINKEISKERKDSSWIMTMPDKKTKLLFETSNDSTKVSIQLDAKPFMDNNLDPLKLPDYMSYNKDENTITISSIYGNKQLNNKNNTINFIYYDIISSYRDKLKYHHVFDHFGIELIDGNAFEYAMDITSNDKDIVIVLNPSIFINASVDIENLEDYKYIDVLMDNGEKVKKLVKVFDLKVEQLCSNQEISC